MYNRSDLALSANFGATFRLKDAFIRVERDIIFLRRTLLLCSVLLAVGAAKILHHTMDLPGAVFIWDFIVSICT